MRRPDDAESIPPSRDLSPAEKRKDGGQHSPSAAETSSTCVTLVIYAWDNVQPGVLAWEFSNLDAAISAAEVMRNAASWVVIRGKNKDVYAARKSGQILAESSRPFEVER